MDTVNIASNYGKVREALEKRVPFRHSSMSAHQDGDTYKVLSYSTVVAEWTTGEQPWLTDDRYSVTTSKHMGQIRRAWKINS